MSPKNIRYLIVVMALTGIVLLIAAPNQPFSKSQGQAPIDLKEERLQQAVLKVEGANPMEGILELRQLAEEFPDFADARLYLGMFSLQSGQTEKAAEHFNKVLEIDSLNAEAHWQLGYMYFGMADAPKAVHHLSEVLRINHHDYFAAHFFLGQALEETGDIANAMINYREVLAHTDDSTVVAAVKEKIERINRENKIE